MEIMIFYFNVLNCSDGKRHSELNIFNISDPLDCYESMKSKAISDLRREEEKRREEIVLVLSRPSWINEQ